MSTPAPQDDPRIYRGIRTPTGLQITVEDQGRNRPLPHQVYHSPDGFEWGYTGSGPADLARSILTDLYGPGDLVERHYHDFKRQTIATLPHQHWTLSAQQIRDTITDLERHHEHSQQADLGLEL